MYSSIENVVTSPHKRILTVLLFLLVLFIFFFRGYWFEGRVSLSNFISIISALLLMITLADSLAKKKIWLPQIRILLFTFFCFLTPLLAISYFQEPLFPSVRISFEILLNIMVYYLFYILIARKYVQPNRVFVFIAAASILVSIWIISEIIQLQSLRRFNDMATGVNFMANSIAVGSIISLYWVLSIKRSRKLKITIFIILLVQFSALLFCGSRSSIIAFIVGSSIMFIFGGFLRSKNIVILLMLLVGLGFVVNYIFSDIAYQSLAFRFDANNIASNLQDGRLQIWKYSLSFVSVENLFFGKPWHYELFDSGILYPHNIFISMLIYMGLIPTLLFFWILIKTVLDILRTRSANNLQKSFLVSLILVPIIYASVSGNFTRIITIFAILGLIDGWLNSGNKGQNNQI